MLCAEYLWRASEQCGSVFPFYSIFHLSEIADYIYICLLCAAGCHANEPLSLWSDGTVWWTTGSPPQWRITFPSRAFQLHSTLGLSFSRPQAYRLSHFINWFSATAVLIPPPNPRPPQICSAVRREVVDEFTQQPVQTAAWRVVLMQLYHIRVTMLPARSPNCGMVTLQHKSKHRGLCNSFVVFCLKTVV
jgi:hypothetical protein